MLAREHRIRRAEDFRSTLRKGARVGARGLVVSAKPREQACAPTRFGYVITKRVGVAVVRNTLRRRLRHLSLLSTEKFPEGWDFVVRVQPECAELTFQQLAERFNYGIHSAVVKAGKAKES